ncbi:protein kinase [Streptomyces sp. NPDC020917]|uniref:protein kinase domain-containing protein n=1 Tax=Streptomyces sp. NPDC020917 TaxID=3365102 RepID=UPI0037A90947
MPSSVTLTLCGAPTPATYVFDDRTTCLVGRARECGIPLAATEKKVSRHHCVLDVNPPLVRVRDLGSRNGTYVNGERLAPGPAGRELSDGDEIRVGGAVLRVSVRSARQPGPAFGEPRDPVDAAHALMAAAEAGEPDAAGIHGYRLLQELGRGGQGVVHLARNEGTGELVALKTLLAHHAVDPSARDGFLREFACTRALRHPHVVAFHGGGAHGSTFYFTSEFCRLGSVADLVARAGGRLGVDLAVGVTLQVLRGLQYAHTAEVPVRLADGTSAVHRGLVHRDIKPQNLLLTGTGTAHDTTVKIADFGLSKAFDSAGLSGYTLTGAMGGTVAFMPRGQVIDFKYARPEVDLWATTATLYWMLTGSPPRDFPDGADPVDIVLHHPPVPVRDRLPSVPRPLAAVIDAALVDQPRITPTTAADLADAIRHAR